MSQEYTYSILMGDEFDEGQIEYIVKNYNNILNEIDSHKIPSLCATLCRKLMNYCENRCYSPETEFHVRTFMKISRFGLFSLMNDGLYGFTPIQAPIMRDLCGELLQMHGFAMFKLNRPFAALKFLDMAEKMFQSYIIYFNQHPGDENADLEYSMIYYEWCRMQEAEVWYSYFKAVPDNMKPLFISIISSYFYHSYLNFKTMGRDNDAEYAFGKMVEVGVKASEYGFPNQSEIDELNMRIDSDSYESWCFNKVLYLNVFNEIPNESDRWFYDEEDRSLTGEGLVIYRDILQSYDHCRRLLYRFTNIDPEIRYNKKRDEDVESLIDCYIRLYSLLDKIASLINIKFSLGMKEPIYFREVAKKLKDSCNPYLRALCDINSDLRPTERNFKKHNLEPSLYLNKVQNSPSVVRNHIMHSGLLLVDDPDDGIGLTDVTRLTVMDLELQTSFLISNIREIILMIRLAESKESWCRNLESSK